MFGRHCDGRTAARQTASGRGYGLAFAMARGVTGPRCTNSRLRLASAVFLRQNRRVRTCIRFELAATPMDFHQRLEKAIERGQRTSSVQRQEAANAALSEEDSRRLHGKLRLPLTDRIEHCLRELPAHFPGFQFESILDDRGWGAAVSRDDAGGGRRNLFSRLEMVVRPFSSLRVLELAAKGTIRNKELFSRTHYQRLTEADPESFNEMIDLWVLEYAELFAARS